MNLESKLEALRARHQREVANLLVEHRLIQALPAQVPTPNQVVFFDHPRLNGAPEPPTMIWREHELPSIGQHLKYLSLCSVGITKFDSAEPAEFGAHLAPLVPTGVLLEFFGDADSCFGQVVCWTRLSDQLVRCSFKPKNLPPDWLPKIIDGTFHDPAVAKVCSSRSVRFDKNGFHARYLGKFAA